MKFRYLFLVAFLATSCSKSYYIVRHAEKGTSADNPADPPLSQAGLARAEKLRDVLSNKKITKIYATPTQRAIATAQPLSVALAVPIEKYGPAPDKAFLQLLKEQKQNTLIIGHSNTVDDIANYLAAKNQLRDLPDQAYDNLYQVKIKGKKIALKELKYGNP